MCSARVSVDVSIVVPTFADGAALARTLPAIAAAAHRLSCSSEIVVVLTPSGDDSVGIIERSLPNIGLRLLFAPHFGKFGALRMGIGATSGRRLLLVDADVVPGLESFERLRDALDRGAQVAMCRPLVARTGAGGMVADLLAEWARLDTESWDIVRAGHPERLWSLPGYLYAIERPFFLEAALVPAVDDASVGLHARAHGARFVYVRDATATFLPPASMRDWFRQKMRTRCGLAMLRRSNRTSVDALRLARRQTVSRLNGAKRFAGRLYRAQERLIWALARIYVALAPDSIGPGWSPALSSKDWARNKSADADPGSHRGPDSQSRR